MCVCVCRGLIFAWELSWTLLRWCTFRGMYDEGFEEQKFVQLLKLYRLGIFFTVYMSQFTF